MNRGFHPCTAISRIKVWNTANIHDKYGLSTWEKKVFFERVSDRTEKEERVTIDIKHSPC